MRPARTAALCALPLLTACVATWQPERAALVSVPIAVRFQRSATERLEVWLQRGMVLVQPGRELSCHVDVRVHAGDEAAARAIAAEIGIQLDEPPHGPTRLRASVGPNVPPGAADIRYVLQVPRHVPLAIETDDARIALRDFDGEVEARTRSGVIDARVRNGVVRLATVSGRVLLRGEYGMAAVTSVEGEVDVILPRAARGPVDLEIRSDTGPVFVEMVEDRRMELAWSTSDGRLRTDYLIEWSQQSQLGADRLLHARGIVNPLAEVPVRAQILTDRAGVALRRLPGTIAASQ